MTTTFEHIILKTELKQSNAFGDLYSEMLDDHNNAICSPLIEDVSEMLKIILIKYNSLTLYQTNMLVKIFEELNRVREEIDPKRLKPFEHYFNSDDELLLFRKTEEGLTNIIINAEECIAFSFIPVNHSGTRQFYFLEEDGDFEKLSYDFLAN